MVHYVICPQNGFNAVQIKTTENISKNSEKEHNASYPNNETSNIVVFNFNVLIQTFLYSNYMNKKYDQIELYRANTLKTARGEMFHRASLIYINISLNSYFSTIYCNFDQINI